MSYMYNYFSEIPKVVKKEKIEFRGVSFERSISYSERAKEYTVTVEVIDCPETLQGFHFRGIESTSSRTDAKKFFEDFLQKAQTAVDKFIDDQAVLF